VLGLHDLLEEEAVRGKEALVAVCGLPGPLRLVLIESIRKLAGGVVVAEHRGLKQ
jgi:hypothetical protein